MAQHIRRTGLDKALFEAEVWLTVAEQRARTDITRKELHRLAANVNQLRRYWADRGEPTEEPASSLAAGCSPM